MATLLVLSMVAMVAAFGGTAAADQHKYDQAPDLTESAEFEIKMPFGKNHYPGDQNKENGSIQYFASGSDALKEELNAEEGAFFDMIIITADWIDYSACTTDNTVVFGIDRGSNNEGTKIDEDLLAHQRENNFRDDGLDVWFYNWGDFAGDPPYFAPDDTVVAAQGEESSGGPCLTLTSEPGWYQLQGFVNGTVADNGPDTQPSEDARKVGLRLRTNYMYVCECDSEQEAREQLGPPPNEEGSSDGGSEETATPTPTPEPADDTDQDTPTPTPEPATDTPTPEPATDTPTPEPTADDAGGQNSGDDSSDSGETASGGGGGQMTPTPGAGPGFGPVIAVLALLASALLVNRRD
jgi:PGF-CTERM protein